MRAFLFRVFEVRTFPAAHDAMHVIRSPILEVLIPPNDIHDRFWEVPQQIPIDNRTSKSPYADRSTFAALLLAVPSFGKFNVEKSNAVLLAFKGDGHHPRNAV